MMIILESFKSFKYKEDDVILIHYWWDNHITPVRIVEKKGRKYKISYNVDACKIKNAPEEWIALDDIIDIYRK